MLHSIPTELTAALPFIFVTGDMHAISPAVVERGLPPTLGALTKLYWSAHLQELKDEFSAAKAMGSATVEEWLKGLEGRGLERRSDASRWEKWAAGNSALGQIRNVLYPGYSPPPAGSIGDTSERSGTIMSSKVHIPGLASTRNSSRAASPSAASTFHNNATPVAGRRSSSGAVSLTSGRPPERTKEEVTELKSARRIEIERRALELDPPLSANILAHIPSFQAALQIITPMDDQGWELLKPRLLAQRAEAEQREQDSTARLQRELDDKRNQTTAAKEAREAGDADWDAIQAPLRAQIAGFADEIIRDGWGDGEKVNRDTCSKFAVEVLTYIRKRFYAEVAKDKAAARAAGKPASSDPPQGPFTQKLTLENMKWIFEVKVKPHTEQYRKEIFLCSGCGVTVRYYGFEGVIQHYAAKHTNTLSIGNVVVHWRAEWPEQPPFTAEQKTTKSSSYRDQPAPAYPPGQSGPAQSYQAPSTVPTPAYGPPSWSEPYSQASQPPHVGAVGGYSSQVYGASNYAPAESFHPYPAPQTQQQGYTGPAQNPPMPPYTYNYGAYQSNSQLGFAQAPTPPFSHQFGAQLDEMARIARELWNATSNMKDALSIVRVQVVIYHLAKRFHAKFGTPLPLSTFIDGLSNHKDMRPVRNVNGLICRVCHQGLGGYGASEEERKSWSLPQLTAHFQSKHVEPFVRTGQYGQPPEWTVDMVLLPEPAAVTNLRAAISMDGQKSLLVSEAVPHLLPSTSVPPSTSNEAPDWHNSNQSYQAYQAVPAGPPAQFYEQHPDGTTHGIGSAEYQQAPGTTPAFSNQAELSRKYGEPTVAAVASIPHSGVHLTSEATVTVAGVALSRVDSNGGSSSQGRRQRHAKKNKKKGGNGRDASDDEARKRKEEEEKMAEEEAEREAAAIRAMWAADRAITAKKSVLPDEEALGTPDQAEKPRDSPNTSNASPKASTPQQRNRAQSRLSRNSPRRLDRQSPLSTPDSRLSQVPPPSKDPVPRGHQLSNVIYMDGNEGEQPRTDRQRLPDRPEERGPPPAQSLPRARSRNPGPVDYEQPPAARRFDERSPLRQTREPVSQPRPSAPETDIRYSQGQSRRADYVPREYPPPAPAPGPASSGDLIEYEIIEYQNPDGTIWVEERPLRRIPNAEAERYYRNAPAPARAPYGRSEFDPPYPPEPYRQNHPRPPGLDPTTDNRGGTIPPDHWRRDPPPPHSYEGGEPYRPAYDRGYSRAPPPPPQHHPAPGSEYYDPGYPAGGAGPSRRSELPSQLPEQAHYEEEYDPRYPAGPPHAGPSLPRPQRYR